MGELSGRDPVHDALRRDIRSLTMKRRRDIAHRLFDAVRAAREETGYGAIEDNIAWARRVVGGRDE